MEQQQEKIIVGLDEAGRGPLAGPVVAGAVILDPTHPIRGLKDSKQLTEAKRESLFALIQKRAIAWAVGHATVEEIDQINILQASLLAMQRAVAALGITPHLALVDGNKSPEFPFETQAIISGDDLVPVISAASIVAKVTRDREMRQWHEQFPQYGFNQHKGYSTRQHLDALLLHGPSIIHRKTFSPVAIALNVS